MAEMKLIPFEVKEIKQQSSEVPYGVAQIKAPELWEKNQRGEGTVVAILDTGIDTTHPDLGSRIVDGRNFTNDGHKDDFSDQNGHGTHVAGTIGAVENGSGVVGVAPETKFLVCKVLDRNGSGSYKSITNAIRYATKWRGKNGERVRVINMSLGGSFPDDEQYQAILKACSQGISVVVASGNEGDANEDTYEYGYPSLYQECITVGACDENEKLARFSNNHKRVDVLSAGVDVLSTYPNSQYAILSGTSMATPHVAGALALIIGYGEKYFGRTLDESEIFALLVRCARGVGYKPSSQGHGIVDLSILHREYPISE